MRQLNDVREISELERQLDNALGVIQMIESEMKMARMSVVTEDPFKLMVALAEANKKIREAMHFALAAQHEHMKPIIKEASRLA